MRLLRHLGSERIYATCDCPVRLCLWLATALALLCNVWTNAHADTSGQTAGATFFTGSNAPAEMQVSVGLGRVWKIGQITPVRVVLPQNWAAQAASIEVDTFDGEGVPVTYRQAIAASNLSQSRDCWCSVTIGRADRPVVVRVLNASSKIIATSELSGSKLGTILPPTQAWIVAVGSSLGVEATSFTLSDTGLPNFTTTVITAADQMPPHWQGLSGCDVLILATTPASAEADIQPAGGSTSGAPVVAGLKASQWEAIGLWVQHGGLAVISLGEFASRMPKDAALGKLLPGAVVDSLSNVSTSSLEAATATNIQLAPISAARLTDVRGQIELTMLDSLGKRFPWWVRYTHGKGTLHYIGSDLDQPVLREWKDRRLVWDKVLASFWSREERNDAPSAERNVSGTTYLGYDDLVGQLRATLDYFPTARIFSFGTIALILSLLLIVIGPVDYWISVHWLRRPQTSWYLGGIVLLATSAALIWTERVSRPKEVLLNSAQVVDFLPEQNRVLVDSWTHLYSSRARIVDVDLRLASSAADVRLDWQGLPGKGLGGMESNLLADQGMPAYRIELASPTANTQADHAASEARPTDKSTEQATRAGRGASISGVGIPTSGTKCLYSTWSDHFTPSGESQLSELKGIDQVQGILINPLPYDILRPVLMYHNWAYSLPSRLRAGEELTLTYEMVPKDLMRRLNRRQIINGNDVITRWMPDDRQSLDRLLEIMMFYKASGGADYARLKHRFQPRIDASNALVLDHAVLFGQLAEPLGNIQLVNVPNDQIKQGSSSTWCRVLLPVARAEE